VVDKPRAFACIDAMRPMAARHGVSVAQIALAWLLAQPAVSTIIIGAKNIEQLNDNIAATKLVLDADELAVLDEVSRLPSEYPAWMLALQGTSRAKPPMHE
jgi:aryl-alcohol dehydrogenase-like predicted oxidoreductase